MPKEPVTPRTRKPPEERRRDVADAVLRIIAERGLSQLSAAAIASEVGVTDAALFHHFRGMEEIMLAAVDRAGELLFAPLPRDEGDPWDRLARFFRQRISAMEQYPGIGRLILSDVLEQVAPPAGVAKVIAFKRQSVAFIRACLSAAEKRDTLAPGVNVPEATVLVLGALMALTQARPLAASRNGYGDMADKTWTLIERALCRRSQEAKNTRRRHRP